MKRRSMWVWLAVLVTLVLSVVGFAVARGNRPAVETPIAKESDALRTRALGFAAAHGKPSSRAPRAVAGTRRSVVAATMGGAVVNTDEHVFVVQVEGAFVVNRGPYGAARPRGSYLLLVYGADDLELTGWALRPTPVDLTQFGPVHAPSSGNRDGGAMRRLNFLADEPWDEVNDADRMRVRWFGHPFGADILGASLRELLPGSPGGWLHMHYGVEEMFFVLAGTPTVRTPEGEERLVPGDVVYFPEGPDGMHNFSNPTDEPVRLLAVSSKRFPDVVAYPEQGVAWVATRHPERPVPEEGDEGIIARFDLPPSR